MKMNFAALVQAQKMRIRAERACETHLISSDGRVYAISDGMRPLRDSEDILRELDGLRGLNTPERARFADGVSRRDRCAA